jgi:hypothetical protein
MPRAITLYPHYVSTALGLRLSDFLDESQEQLDFSEVEQIEGEEVIALRYDLSRPELPWQDLSFRTVVTLSDEELGRVLAPTSDLEVDSALILSITCAVTRLRRRVVLEQTRPGTWRGDVVLNRRDLKGTVMLRPLLVRRTELPSTDVAAQAELLTGAIIAEGREARLVVDPPVSAIEGTLRVRWDDFRASKDPWRRDHSSELMYLEAYGDRPTLWLNSRYAELKAALHSRSRQGPNAILRDMTAALYAQTAWLQLITAALGSVILDEDNLEEPIELHEEHWKREALEDFLPRMYPFRERGGVGPLVSRLGTAVQEKATAARLLESAVRAAARERVEQTEEIA